MSVWVCPVLKFTRYSASRGKNSLDVPNVPEARKADNLAQSLRKSGPSEGPGEPEGPGLWGAAFLLHRACTSAAKRVGFLSYNVGLL